MSRKFNLIYFNYILRGYARKDANLLNKNLSISVSVYKFEFFTCLKKELKIVEKKIYKRDKLNGKNI